MSLTEEMLRVTSSVDRQNFGRTERKPSGQLIQDTITPYKICVLVLVRLYLESKGDYGANTIIYSRQERRSLMMLFMELIKVPDMSFNHLLMKINSSVNATLFDRFNTLVLERLANGGSCEFYSFFDRLNEPIRDNLGNELTEFTILNKTSVIGIVVRSMLVGFKMMSLEEVISSVISEFSKYCEEFTSKNNYSQSEFSLSSPRPSKQPIPSRWQSMRRITQLAGMLEQNPRQAGTPAEISEEMDLLLKTYPSLYRVHYVQYLNHMRVKEYAGAKECLHRFFDKMAEAGDRSSSKDCVNDFNRCSRYASLNLASLYARFGHRDLALHNVREAVKLAQEVNDKNCLQHALIWLEYLSSSSNVDGVAPGLALWEMSLTGSLIKTLKYTSLDEHPKTVFDELAKALSFQTRNVRDPEHNNVKNISKLSQMTLCASLWNYYGHRNMASLISQNVLHTDSSVKGTVNCTELECLALCLLSQDHFNQGKFESAESILNVAKENFAKPYPFSEIWNKVEQCQLSDRAFFHRDIGSMILASENLMALDPVEAILRNARLHSMQGHYHRALKIIEGILSSESIKPQSFVNGELRIRTLLERIHVYCEMKDHSNAMKYIIDCLEITKENYLIYEQSLCQLYAAHVQLMNGNAEESFTIMRKYLPYLLIHGSCYDKGRAQLLYTKCKIAQAKCQSKDKFAKVVSEGLDILDQAAENFQHCEAFIYHQDTLMYMAILCNMIGDISRRNNCSYQYKQIDLQLPLDKDVAKSNVIL